MKILYVITNRAFATNDAVLELCNFRAKFEMIISSPHISNSKCSCKLHVFKRIYERGFCCVNFGKGSTSYRQHQLKQLLNRHFYSNEAWKILNYRVIFLAHVHWHDTLQLVDICDCCHPMAWHVIFAPACERTPITPATAPFNYRITLVFGPRKFPLSVNVRFCNKTEFDMKYKSESIQIMANESSSLVLCGVRCSICEFCPLHNDAVI